MTDMEREQIISLRQLGYGYTKIANILGIGKNTVKSFCRRNEVGGVARKTNEQHCENCGCVINQIPGRKKKRFCSDKCRNRWWNSNQNLVKRKAIYTFVCPSCHKEFSSYGNANRKYCSHECYIEDRFGGVCVCR